MSHNGKDTEKLVAIVSPWEKLPALARRNFRIESLPTEKKVQVWRDDLQSPELLTAELSEAGVTPVEVRSNRITNWKAVE